MSSHKLDVASAVRSARVAGLCYIVIIGLGVAQAMIASPLVALGEPASTAISAPEHELLFRMGVLGDVALYTLVLVLSVALYLLLKEVDQPLALGAFVLRSAEGVVGLAVTVLGGLMPLLLLSSAADDPAVPAAFLSLRESALDIILILIGPGGAVFCYLFLQSRLVPRALAVWGILTYASMIILGSSRLLLPDLPSWITTLLYAQGGLFEVLFGLWLLVKAVDVSAYTQLSSSPG